MTDTKTLQQVRTIVGFKGSENLEACRPKPGPPLPIPNRHTLCHGNSPERGVFSERYLSLFLYGSALRHSPSDQLWGRPSSVRRVAQRAPGARSYGNAGCTS